MGDLWEQFLPVIRQTCLLFSPVPSPFFLSTLPGRAYHIFINSLILLFQSLLDLLLTSAAPNLAESLREGGEAILSIIYRPFHVLPQSFTENSSSASGLLACLNVPSAVASPLRGLPLIMRSAPWSVCCHCLHFIYGTSMPSEFGDMPLCSQLESSDGIEIQTRQPNSRAHVQLLREGLGVNSQDSYAHGSFLKSEVSPFNTDLTTHGLFIFISFIKLGILVWSLMVVTVCFKEPERKRLEVDFLSYSSPWLQLNNRTSDEEIRR